MSFPIDWYSCKSLLRRGDLSDVDRAKLWTLLPTVPREQAINNSDIDAIATNIQETYKSISKTDDIFTMIEKSQRLLLVEGVVNFDQGIIFLRPLIQILSSVIVRTEVCFLTVVELLGSHERFLTPTLTYHRCVIGTFHELLKRFLPKTYVVLENMKALHERYLNKIFVDFFRDILPPAMVLSIIDSFLLEGKKVLFRFGLAFFMMYKREVMK